MDTVSHRLEQVGWSLGQGLRHLLLATFSGFSGSWGHLMERNAVRRADLEADDIAWDDGEPEDKR